MQVTIDALDVAAVLPFWKAVLDYHRSGDEDLDDPLWHSLNISFQELDAPRPQRNRLHVDVYLPRDQAELKTRN